MKVAIIPARGGSKRIPKKNIKTFFGKPMIHYPLKAASDSNLFEKIVVSSDDDEILEVASGFSQSIDCFKRSASLSDDFTPTLPVVQDYILSEKENIMNYVVSIRTISDSKILRDFYKEYTRDKVFYFPTEFPSSIFRALGFQKTVLCHQFLKKM